ncbi:MAG: hypothetical protein K5928_04010, partial [Prevotella sp.]|nr:hypothetical protein [Prevotella sp.]
LMVISSLCTGTRVSHPRLPQVRHLRTGSWLQSYNFYATMQKKATQIQRSGFCLKAKDFSATGERLFGYRRKVFRL